MTASNQLPAVDVIVISEEIGASQVDRMLLIAAQILSTVLTLGASGGMGLYLVAVFVLIWGYGSTCEGLFNGQTVGKRLMGIRVVSDRGVPITGEAVKPR